MFSVQGAGSMGGAFGVRKVRLRSSGKGWSGVRFSCGRGDRGSERRLMVGSRTPAGDRISRCQRVAPRKPARSTGGLVRTRGSLAAGTALLSLLLLAPDARAAVVRGVATYREREPLPAEARFEALLEDVTRPGAAVVIGRAKVAKPTGYIPFEITYAPDRIQTSHAYAVRARISLGDRLLYVSEQPAPALTRGSGNAGALVMGVVSLASDSDLGRRGTLDDLPASFTGL